VQTLRPTLLFSGFRHFVPFHTARTVVGAFLL